MAPNRIAIIGAGMAGLACATRLTAANRSVRLFDKARGPGGRMATRRITLPDDRVISFDHGAQYASARGMMFAALCERLEREGVARPYPWPVFDRPESFPVASRRFCGAPGMNAIPKALARWLDVACGRHVTALTRTPEGWRLSFADGEAEGGFVAVVLAMPAEQTAPLVARLSPAFAQEAAAARTAPCWAAMLAFEGGGEPAFGAVRLHDGGPLAWLARTADGQGWVAHATADWSQQNLEVSPSAVAERLEQAARRLLPTVGGTLMAQAHRWRFAQVETAAGTPFGWDDALALGVCGDWRLGPRVEQAWLSGERLGEIIATAEVIRRRPTATDARARA